MGFNCSGCGCCCKRVGEAVERTKHIKELSFPYDWDKNGKCEMLGDDNKCKVYDSRPLICNVDKLREFLDYPQEEWHELNRFSCNYMMDLDNIPLEFRV